MGKTKDNLQKAFAGESQANRMYIAFAAKAQQEGFAQVAKLFRAAAESETIHALAHFKAMGAVGDTAENVEKAIKGENYEHTEMYPDFIAQAKEEADKIAERTFTYAMNVEKYHENEFIAAKKAVEAGKDLPEEDLYVCKVCGYVSKGKPPMECPVCGSGPTAFKKVD
ncbi:MAG: hypothetical protein PWQ88_818 [Candidatus Methanomethylophilaceae archaeon]|jgi:Rubrerythrin|nr:hypothetical protein [Candidatus Methanomethylophilaceae archaeon]MDI3541214.1 hypothetical protein [Candidatus Methanomethylophilaceae archaeon]HIJ00611.1 rubrerythrin family protein [Candidatus Methanomethylophilaceae archaeon]